VVEQFRRERPDALILLKQMDHPERFGVAELEGDRVIRLTEKPKTPRSDLVLVGVYLFKSTIMEAVDAIVPSSRGELEITDAIQWRSTTEGRHSHVVAGRWIDTARWTTSWSAIEWCSTCSRSGGRQGGEDSRLLAR